MIDLYCTDPDCDCRNVYIHVVHKGFSGPPEDVGGIHGYQQMLEVLKKSRHPEKAGYIEWLGLVAGEKWDAKFCSIREVNKSLVLLER